MDDRHSLPNELIYKILVALLGYSILDICTLGPHAPLLEKHVVVTVATTCKKWHEILKNILFKAFGNNLSEGGDSSIFCETRMILSSLSTIGTRLHHKPSPSSDFLNNLPLTKMYSHYLTSIALRRHVSESHDLVIKTHSTLQAALNRSWDACNKVTPKGLVDTVRGQIQCELWIIEVDYPLAEACIALERCAEDFCQVLPEECSSKRLTTEIDMNKALSLAESAIEIPRGLCSMEKKIEYVQHSIDTSGIMSTLTMMYSSGNLDFSKYNLKNRALEYGKISLRGDSLIPGLPGADSSL